MNPDFVSVIVPAHNEEQHIHKCLTSLIYQDYPSDNYEIIVVDNNSTDRTLEIAENFDVKVISQRTGTVGAVRNAGVKASNGKLLAFIDADCIAPINWLSKGVNYINTDRHVFGGGCDLPNPPHWIELAWLLKNKTPPKDLLGCCIFITKKAFIDVGMFDEEITSGEDTKLSNSLKDKNYTILMINDLNVVHLGNSKTLKRFFSRQVWHSENYFQNWRETRTDPTFYLVSIFLFGIFLCFFHILDKNLYGFASSILIISGVPILFTVKRLRRSQNPVKNLRNLPAIYTLDFIYLCGRAFGLSKSAWKAAKKSVYINYIRRVGRGND